MYSLRKWNIPLNLTVHMGLRSKCQRTSWTEVCSLNPPAALNPHTRCKIFCSVICPGAHAVFSSSTYRDIICDISARLPDAPWNIWLSRWPLRRSWILRHCFICAMNNENFTYSTANRNQTSTLHFPILSLLLFHNSCFVSPKMQNNGKLNYDVKISGSFFLQIQT